MAQLMQTPSDGIDNQLLSHIHLVSANQYPAQSRLDLNHVTKYLVSAPQIAKDKAPFFWTYLNQPNTGTVIMTWQPLTKLGTHFASDGYIWAPEQYHRSDVGNGLILEVYYNRSGFKPGEQMATYGRRRFRLVPSQTGNQAVPQIDMNLWIVHYASAEHHDQGPVAHIPFTPDAQQMMSQRNYLQSCGSIPRKDFMLSDRGHWPRIQWPQGDVGAQRSMYAPPQSRRLPQQAAYPPGGPRGGRRGRGQGQVPQQAPLEMVDDEHQDVFDVLTPRDISLARYKQNHEWMEEILSSPYPIYHISPPDLGLGFKGQQLGFVTDGVFHAPGADALEKQPNQPYTGKLDPEMAAEFKKRAQEHVDSTTAEIEKMKAEHAQAMASIKSNSAINHAEKDLRHSVAERGPEVWRLEGRSSDGDEGSAWSQRHNKKVDDIVAQVEAHLGRQIAALHDVNRIQDGGYKEPDPEPPKEPTPPPQQQHQQQQQQQQPRADSSAGDGLGVSNENASRRLSPAGSQHSGVMVDDADIDMGGTAAGLLDQMHTGLSATSTPLNNFPTPQANLSALNSNPGTPANANVASPAPNLPAADPEKKYGNAAREDVSMGNTEAARMDAPAGNTGPDQGTGSDDWVVVPKEGVSHEAGAGAGAGSSADTGPTTGGASQLSKPAAPAAAEAKQGSAVGTPAVTEGDANDYSSLGDLDTAGDALASYGTPGLDGAAGSLGEDLDLNMDMDGSAFGEAFHGVGNTGTPGENQSEGV